MTMHLEPGMRVRVVETHPLQSSMYEGSEHRIAESDGVYVRVERHEYWYHRWRFKPIVRVRMGRREL